MSQAVQLKSVALESIPSLEVDFMEIDDIIEKKFNNDKENLIMILQAIQRRYNFLPRPALAYLSTKLDVPFSQIYGVATFYSTFSLEPRGRNIVSICLGTACHVRGGERVRERIEGALNICMSVATARRWQSYRHMTLKRSSSPR